MKIEDLIAKTKDSLEARMVYTEPYEKNGTTVIAAARIVGGSGGGTGRDQQGAEGQGSGFGLIAKPTGAYTITDGKVRWEPAIDVNRLVTTIGTIIIAALFLAVRIVKIRAWTATHCTPTE